MRKSNRVNRIGVQSIDDRALACGDGYDPNKNYINIDSSEGSSRDIQLVVIAEEERTITSRGCIERPEKEKFFVTNQDRSAGVWVSPNSAENLTLESLNQVDLPAACSSVVHGNGSGFTLNFEWMDQVSSRDLRFVELGLFPMNGDEALATWPFRPLESTISFSLPTKFSLSSGDYRLVSKIKDRVSNVQSKSECNFAP